MYNILLSRCTEEDATFPIKSWASLDNQTAAMTFLEMESELRPQTVHYDMRHCLTRDHLVNPTTQDTSI